MFVRPARPPDESWRRVTRVWRGTLMSWRKRRDKDSARVAAPAESQASGDSKLVIFGVDESDPESLDWAGARLWEDGQHALAEQSWLASARLGYPRGAANYGFACEQ